MSGAATYCGQASGSMGNGIVTNSELERWFFISVLIIRAIKGAITTSGVSPRHLNSAMMKGNQAVKRETATHGCPLKKHGIVGKCPFEKTLLHLIIII